VIILNGVGCAARIIPPFFADRFGPLNVITPLCFCGVVISWTWLAVDNVPGFYVFTVFYGILLAAFQCIFPATISSITPRPDMTGTRLGMALSLLSFAALTGPPIGGAIQGASGGSYLGSQIWSASLMVISFILIVMARLYKGGWKLTKC
jgi:MFS family permease